LHACLLEGISAALQVPRRPGFAARTWELATDPEHRATQICAEASQIVQQALVAGRPAVPELLGQGAADGMAQAMDVLDKLGHLQGEAGDVVARLCGAWAGQLARLASCL
jgi:hypothetical protein